MKFSRLPLATTSILFFCLFTCGEKPATSDPEAINISLTNPLQIAEVDERFQSYNIEMAEVIGGDFWIPYADMDTSIAPSIGEGTELGENKNRYKYRAPIDLTNERLRMLASALSPAFVRVSGSWANYIYFQDDDQPKMEVVPEGFRYILTRPQWAGVIDFVKDTDADIMTSFAISSGTRNKEGRWQKDQAQALVNYTKSLGGTLDAVQFFNEPNMPEYAGAPKGYSGEDFALDVQEFNRLIDEVLPGIPVAGPDAVGEGGLMPAGMKMPLSTDILLAAEPKPEFDIFAYHHYGGVSQRCATTLPMNSPIDSALTAGWLNKTLGTYDFYRARRDTYLPEKPMWLTETAEAACGGNPWAAEYVDVFRYLSQMGKLAKKDVKIIMHNTLTASDYGMLDQETHKPRPNYWAALLWRQLMGTKVYEAGVDGGELGLYLHSNYQDPTAKTLLVINPTSKAVILNLPQASEQYLLTASKLRTKEIMLNGKRLKLTVEDKLPELKGKAVTAGAIEVPAQGIAFFTF